MNRSRRCSLRAALLALVYLPASANAQTVEQFYSGKTINLAIGFDAGGGYDIYGRLLSRHMSQHIPGKPAIVVQNMPGAGSLRAVNHLYNLAPKDGTAFGTFARGLAMEPLIGTAKVQFDATKFTWLGSGTNEMSVCAKVATASKASTPPSSAGRPLMSDSACTSRGSPDARVGNGSSAARRCDVSLFASVPLR